MMDEKMMKRMRGSEEDMLKQLMKMGGKKKKKPMMDDAEVDVEVDDEMEDEVEAKKKRGELKNMDKKMLDDSEEDDMSGMSKEELIKKIKMMKSKK